MVAVVWAISLSDIAGFSFVILTLFTYFQIPTLYFTPDASHTPHSSPRTVYGSHSLHEVTMYYPMRTLRSKCYKLIHNLNSAMPFPIDQDFYISPTFQDILNRTREHRPLPWIKTLQQYYYRSAWELYNVCLDYKELNNLAYDSDYSDTLSSLQRDLYAWQNVSSDPWICAPSAVLEDSGQYKQHPQCMTMDNGL